MEVVIFIPARAGSKRIPRKNMQLLGRLPLVGHSIIAATRSRHSPTVVVDSDDAQTLNLALSFGVRALDRPAELARDETTADELAYWEASSYVDADVYVQLMPTCPFIKASTISHAINTLVGSDADSVAAVRREVVYEWDDDGPAYFNKDGSIPPSQDKKPIVHEMGLYVSRMAYVLEAKKRANPESCLPVFLSKLEAIDVNWPEDLEFARILWKGLYHD
jgi:N-acylneuraminate cytidylyltransferase